MLLVRHFDILWRRTPAPMVREEVTVAPFQDVYLWVCEMRIEFGIDCPVVRSHMTSHQRRTVGRVLAVKDEKSATSDWSLKKLGSKKLLVIVVHCALDVAALIFVLKSTVHNHFLVKVFSIFAVKDI